jgi:hypothetical protein
VRKILDLAAAQVVLMVAQDMHLAAVVPESFSLPILHKIAK